MSFFGDDQFQSRIGRLKFASVLKDLFSSVKRAKWKVRVTLWDPETGEEWEVTPVGSRQTKVPTTYVECVVVSKEPTE